MTAGPVIIIGGGWAGLAAAVELAAAAVPVHLLEAAPQLGGRARSIQAHAMELDNGQHLLLGAYRETLRLLRRVGVHEREVLARTPLHLAVHRPQGMVELAAPPLPAPLHLLWALWRGRGLSHEERRAALRFCLSAYRSRFTVTPDISVAQLLAAQPNSLIEVLWEPLCLATLNTPLRDASAALFLAVLRDAFSRRRRDSDLLYPITPLGAVLPAPARRYIERHGGVVETRRRVRALTLAAAAVTGVATDGGTLSSGHVVVATAPRHARHLLAAHPPLHTANAQLAQLDDEPIVTLYLRYPPDTTLERTMVGMSGTLTQWLFDRGRLCGAKGLMAAVISGPGAHSAMSNERLAAAVAGEVADRYPHWPAPLETLVIRERRATFRSSVGVGAWRPNHATAVAGLWLAGDYTDTGYPATLEGAVRSGVQCARRIIRQLG